MMDRAAQFQTSENGLRHRKGDQRLPEVNEEVDCQTTFLDRINIDVPMRRQIGIERYATALQPFNGRDSVRDAWEEYCDLGAYIEQMRRERARMLFLLRSVAYCDAETLGPIRDEIRSVLESLNEAPHDTVGAQHV